MPPCDFLNQTALVSSRASADRGYADRTPSWSPVPGQDALPCLVRPLRPEAVAKQGRDAEKVWVRIYFDADPGLTRNNRLTVDGRIYAVVGQLDFNSMARLFAVDCTQVVT